MNRLEVGTVGASPDAVRHLRIALQATTYAARGLTATGARGQPARDPECGKSRGVVVEAVRAARCITIGHWSIESVYHIIDMNYDEDRGRIRTGHGPENITRLRRFAVGVLKSFQKRTRSIAQMMRKLSFRPRLVLDYLRITANSATGARVPREQICLAVCLDDYLR